MDIQAARADVTGQCSHQHDGVCADHFRDIAVAALEALEEAQKIVDILKAHGMNLRVVQVPPPIVDHERLYALKDAVNAYDAILGESE